MLRNLSEKLGAKFPSTTGRISHYDGAFLEILGLEESPEEHRKDKGQAKTFLPSSRNFDFSTCPNRNSVVQQMPFLVYGKEIIWLMSKVPLWITKYLTLTPLTYVNRRFVPIKYQKNFFNGIYMYNVQMNVTRFTK